MGRVPLLLAVLLAAAVPEEPKDKAPPGPEATTETLHGHRVEILAPAARPADGYSLLVFFHSDTGNGKESVAKLAPLAERGFVVAAPWAKQGWAVPEMEDVKSIARDLVGRYSVARERRHAGGLWSGGDGVQAVAFDGDLGFRTATWVNASWGGGTLPKRAKEELCGLFLWGPKEGASRIDRYRKSSSMLSEKARLSVARGEEPAPGQPRSGREEPDLPLASLPFWGYFMESMEGRFAPERDLSFPWGDDLAAARALMAERKTGGFAYVYAAKPDAAEAERMKALQNGVLFDRAVRHFADQLVPVRLEKGAAKELLESAKVSETPAVVVFKKGGKEILKVAAGEITAKALVPLLRAAAPDQEMPR